jgi:hypothetical protein
MTPEVFKGAPKNVCVKDESQLETLTVEAGLCRVCL